MFYRLDGKNIIEITARELDYTEEISNILFRNELPGNVLVSTIFIGIGVSIGANPPLLFETMIFGGEHDEYVKKYATYDEAEAGHNAAINLIFSV